MTATQNYNLVPYQMQNGKIIDVIKHQNDIWMTTEQIAELYGCSQRNIQMHLKNIYKIGELDKKTSTKSFFVASNGEGLNPKNIRIERTFHNRRAIFHLGYRVNSKMGVMFRNWASDVLEEKVAEPNKFENKIITEKKARAALINNELKKMGITQGQIGQMLGLSYVSVSNAIHGKCFCLKVENWLKENIFKEAEHNLISKSIILLKDSLNGDKSSFEKLTDLLNSVAVVHDFNGEAENV